MVFHRAYVLAKLDTAHQHFLRHTPASRQESLRGSFTKANLDDDGVPMKVVQKKVGQVQIGTVRQRLAVRSGISPRTLAWLVHEGELDDDNGEAD